MWKSKCNFLAVKSNFRFFRNKHVFHGFCAGTQMHLPCFLFSGWKYKVSLYFDILYTTSHRPYLTLTQDAQNFSNHSLIYKNCLSKIGPTIFLTVNESQLNLWTSRGTQACVDLAIKRNRLLTRTWENSKAVTSYAYQNVIILIVEGTFQVKSKTEPRVFMKYILTSFPLYFTTKEFRGVFVTNCHMGRLFFGRLCM